jgi:hypothetical protein
MPSLNDIAEALKNAGLVLTTASGVGYACGYLVTRARAYALGTDPGFALIDQAYVWAGIRLLIVLLFAMLLSALPVLLLREGWHLILDRWPGATVMIECGVALVAGAAIILLAARIFGVSNLIFADPRAVVAAPLPSAVLGRSSLGTILFVVSTALAMIIALWLRSHLSRCGADMLALLLGVMWLLLSVLLPIEHGFFFADRKVRALDRMPDGVTGLQLPIWIVERGAGERVVLFGRNLSGAAQLVPVKADNLDGIAVTAVADLGDVLIQETRP